LSISLEILFARRRKKLKIIFLRIRSAAVMIETMRIVKKY